MKNTAKVFMGIVFLSCFILLNSCSKSKSELIIGKWFLDSASSTYSANGSVTIHDVNPSDVVEGLMWEFASNGYLYDVSGERAIYKIVGDNVSIERNGDTWSLHIVGLERQSMDLSFEEDTNTTIFMHFIRI